MKSSISFAVFAFCFLAVGAVLGLNSYDTSPSVVITCIICLTVGFVVYCGIIGYHELDDRRRAREKTPGGNLSKLTEQVVIEAKSKLEKEWKDSYYKDLETHRDQVTKKLKAMEDALKPPVSPKTDQLAKLIAAVPPNLSFDPSADSVSPELLRLLIDFVEGETTVDTTSKPKKS